MSNEEQNNSLARSLEKATANVPPPPRGSSRVLTPTGHPITFDDLPPADTKRWVTRRKAAVVAGVRAGLLSLDEACDRYALSVDEFLSWQRRLERHGLAGLRTTRVKEYRRGA